MDVQLRVLAKKKGVVKKLISLEERGKYSKEESIYIQMLMGMGNMSALIFCHPFFRGSLLPISK